MGRLFKAVLGLGIAFYVWSPRDFAAHFETSALASVRQQIEAGHPHRKLLIQWTDAASAIRANNR